MNFFDIIYLIGGLSLFLFGMTTMSSSIERRAGKNIRRMLSKITGGKVAGVTTGLVVTGIAQSSSTVIVMLVGLANSEILTLSQAINAVIGSNIGKTVTAWFLSLNGIQGDSFIVSLFKPTTFAPIIAFVGIFLLMFTKNNKTKDFGTILLGFATLMFGMDVISKAVSELSKTESFRVLFAEFSSPLFGMIVGTLGTAVIQSSSASVGILQAFAITGNITWAAAIPIIMGQNIGTCITGILSSFGGNSNGKRTALSHLTFNVVGTVIWLSVYSVLRATLAPAFLETPIPLYGIAAAHTIFNVLTAIVIFPFTGLLEKFVCRVIPEKNNHFEVVLDERLLNTPSVALEQCRFLTIDMASFAVEAINDSLEVIFSYDDKLAKRILEAEEKSDYYEDILGSYLVKISSAAISDDDSAQATKLLKMIGDFEIIADHAVNILKSSTELYKKKMSFSVYALEELDVLTDAVKEVVSLAYRAFATTDIPCALNVEPLEQVIDSIREQFRTNHVLRLQQGTCSIEAGFIWSDLLSNLSSVSDHCSNIAGAVMELANNNMNIHESLRQYKTENDDFEKVYEAYSEKYSLNGEI